jgi:hypothetical protein
MGWIKLSEDLSQRMTFMSNVMSCVTSQPFENLPTSKKLSSQRELYVKDGCHCTNHGATELLFSARENRQSCR